MSQVICSITIYATFSVLLTYNDLDLSFAILAGVVVALGIPASVVFYTLAPENSINTDDRDRESSLLLNWMYREGLRRALIQKDFGVLLLITSLCYAVFYLVGLYMPMFVLTTLEMVTSNYEAMIYVPVAMSLSLFVAGASFMPLVSKIGRKAVFIMGSVCMIIGALIMFATQPSFSQLIYFSASLLSFGKALLFISSLSLQALYAGSQSLVSIVVGVIYLFADILIGCTVYFLGQYVPVNSDTVRWITCGVPLAVGVIMLLLISTFELPQGGMMLMRLHLQRLLDAQQEEQQRMEAIEVAEDTSTAYAMAI
eukprot:TRINITY_DN28652_c0_g1_i1.p1 TRINITY_DN28652_c0_g1~~TRINITY_DN28652_c0_g1_i1.p1  ORF type:complete len:312 (-),score=62.75 TRINITY_DN28652_c0_g1_i1:80-1015(-)